MRPGEIIRRNLEFSGPERIGFHFNGDWGRLNDFAGGGVGPSSTWQQKRWQEGKFEYYDDEWGNIWHRIAGMSQKGEIFRPALEDWSRLDTLHIPDFDAPERYEEARRGFSASPDHYHMAGLPGFPFAICRYLRKMEIYFQDLLLERENIDHLHGLVTDLLERVINRFADAGAEGIIFAEDWGIQDRLLISPNTWREIFKPLYARLCGAAHARGMHVLMHSCGYNWDILEDLAETGVNAFQFDQPELYGLERLAGRLRELKVCLYSPVDIQKTMQSGDKKTIQDAARRMVELFGGPEGGLIAKNYGDLPGIGVEREWDDWAYEAFVQAGSSLK